METRLVALRNMSTGACRAGFFPGTNPRNAAGIHGRQANEAASTPRSNTARLGLTVMPARLQNMR
jgi:hypothetical protein